MLTSKPLKSYIFPKIFLMENSMDIDLSRIVIERIIIHQVIKQSKSDNKSNKLLKIKANFVDILCN